MNSEEVVDKIGKYSIGGIKKEKEDEREIKYGSESKFIERINSRLG